MKKILALLLILSLLLTIVACGNNDNDTEEQSSESGSEKSKDSDVAKKSSNVEVTIPRYIFEDEDGEAMDIEEINEEAKEEGVEKVEVNDDGSITYTMPKATHEIMLEELEKGLMVTIDEIVNDEEVTSIKSIVTDKPFSEIEVVVDKETFENSINYMFIGVISYVATYYQFYDGVKIEDAGVILNIKDESTQEIYETMTYPEDFGISE